MKQRQKRQLTLAAGFVLYFGALWYFWYTPVVYPLKIFVVLLHELSHATALLLTGGAVDSITLDPAQGGATWGRGGSRFITLSACYLGSLVFGGLLVLGAQSKRIRSDVLLGIVGGSVLILTAVYIRNGFGVAFGILFGLGVLLSSRHLGAIWSARVLTALGLTSVGYAIFDIKSDIIDRPEVHSDAFMLSQLTGIPTIFWGILWIGLGVAAATLLLRRAINNA